jgi:hypothetical protein
VAAAIVRRYRRRKQARERAALQGEVGSSDPTIARVLAFTRQLQAELAEVARCQAVTAAIIGELSPGAPVPHSAKVNWPASNQK